MTITTQVSGLKLFGTRYRCRLRYLHVEAMDALSDFVLQVANASPQYQRIEVLLQSFGLPPRIMEDVLADLIRTRRALLDVARGRIVPVGGRTGAAEYEDRRMLDVWQDHVTGAVLPASFVAPYTTMIEDAEPLGLNSDYQEFIGFLEASDASLLSSLARVDPTLRYSLDGTWQLDRFVNRVRLNGQPIWVPLAWTTVREIDAPFVDVPEIPWWLAKAWTAHFRREKQIARVEIGVERPSILDGDGATANAFQYARIRFHAGRWLDSAQEHLDLSPPPESSQEVRTFEQRFGALQARLLSLLSTTIRTNVRLSEEVAEASSSIILAAPNLASADAWGLSDAMPRSADTALIHGTLEDVNAKPLHRSLSIPGWRDEFALIDGFRLLLPLTDAGGARNVVEITGPDIGRAIDGLLRRQLGIREAGSLLSVPYACTTRDDLKEVRFAVDGQSVGEVLGELIDFRREFVLAMQDQRLRKPSESIGGSEATVDGLVRTVDETPKIALGESHPLLAERLRVLRRPLSHPLALNHSGFTFVEQGELLDLLDLIVAEPPGPSDLCRIVSHVSEVSLEDEVVGTLMRGVDLGWRFNICVPGDAEQVEYARGLRTRLPSLHVRFFATPTEWQASVVTVNDVVVIGTFRILADRSTSRLSQAWAIVLGDVAVGNELLSDSGTWMEIAIP